MRWEGITISVAGFQGLVGFGKMSLVQNEVLLNTSKKKMESNTINWPYLWCTTWRGNMQTNTINWPYLCCTTWRGNISWEMSQHYTVSVKTTVAKTSITCLIITWSEPQKKLEIASKLPSHTAIQYIILSMSDLICCNQNVGLRIR